MGLPSLVGGPVRSVAQSDKAIQSFALVVLVDAAASSFPNAEDVEKMSTTVSKACVDHGVVSRSNKTTQVKALASAL